MTVYEALSILEISGSYDEKELKRVWRELAKKYHPDNFKYDEERKKAEDKLKQINIAYEILLNNIEINTNFSQTYDNYYQDNRTVVFNMKIAKKELLRKYQAKKYKITLSIWVFYIDEIILDFTVKDYSTVDEINYNYQKALENIISIYKEFEEEFYQKNQINKDEIIETINYNCSFDDFFEQLLKIKEKYGFENVFLRKIEEATEKYKYYAGYDMARAEIEAQKRKKYNKKVGILQKNIDIFTIEELYKLMQVFLKQLEDEIEEIFSQVFVIKNKIDKLESIVYETNDTEIINEFIAWKANFERGQLFEDALNGLEHFELLIRCKKVLKSVNINNTFSDSDIIYYGIDDKYYNKIKLDSDVIDDIDLLLDLGHNISDDIDTDKPNVLKFNRKKK